jgi:hypothetical protein
MAYSRSRCTVPQRKETEFEAGRKTPILGRECKKCLCDPR